MNRFDLKDKKVLITGASSGIGKQAAITLSKANAELIIIGRNEERLQQTLETLYGNNHQSFNLDLTNEDSISELVKLIPNIDGIVHAAGITGHTPSQFIKRKHIDQIFNINFIAPVLLMSALLKKKKVNDKGSVLFLSSIASKQVFFGGSLYSSSKAALEVYAKTLAVELGTKKIRVNCLSPSFVQTEMVEQAKEIISDDKMKLMESSMPLGFGTPDDVTGAILFFMSDASSWITGTNLPLGAIQSF